MALAYYLRLGKSDLLSNFTGASMITITIHLFTFYIFDIYSFDYKFTTPKYFVKLLIAVALGSVFVAFSFYIIPHYQFGRGIFLIKIIFLTIFMYLWRMLFGSYILGKGIKKNIAIIGVGGAGQTIYQLLRKDMNYKIVGFFDDNPELQGKNVGQHTVLGDSKYLKEMAKKNKIDTVVIAITHDKKNELFKNILTVKMAGVDVFDMPLLYEELSGKVPVKHIKDSWFINTTLSGIKSNIYTHKIERFLDMILCVLWLIVSLPISLITIVSIKLGSKGKIFYIQERVGLNGKSFRLVKFRSMKEDAEVNGAKWAVEGDIRVTKVGKIIRKLRIDEIPQLWNVLKGDISLIGPRPERPEFVRILEKEIPYYSLRHSVRPGLTGWAQVNYRYGASKKDTLQKLQYDFYYIKNKSLLLDLLILLKTVKVVLLGSGAR